MGFRVVVVHGGSEFVSLVMAGQFGFRWMTTLHGEVAIWLEVWWLWWLIVVGGAFFIVVFFWFFYDLWQFLTTTNCNFKF